MERDIGSGKNKDLDCPYIIRYGNSNKCVSCKINRYKMSFEQDGNTFVVMDYMENGLKNECNFYLFMF
jgi:hypothetical protein